MALLQGALVKGLWNKMGNGLLYNAAKRQIGFTSCLWVKNNDGSPTPPPPPPPPDPGNHLFLKKKYSDTILLPKTEFPMKIPHNKRDEHETDIANQCQFEQLYSFQSLWRRESPEFILHDGPPYANGHVHMGHAVNKILKDITNRYKLLRGYQINYIPGWDCHGLPIELKAVKEGKKGVLTDPIAIRNAARAIVDQSIASHIEAFRRWGILAEWDSPYKTLDKSYVKVQLQSFLDLYEKNLVYRDVKPVFWSPSSRTALAEAELEYNPNHHSPSVLVALDITSDVQDLLSKVNLEKSTDLDKSAHLQAVIWTTTPWTLPANKAVAFQKSAKYSLLEYKGYKSSYYIVASELKNAFFAEKNATYRTVAEFTGEELAKLSYRHPWFENQTCPFVHGDHVTMEKGTGLVHIAPAHGHDDFVLGLKNGLANDCYVNNEGDFDNTISDLKGLDALTAGNEAVLIKLGDRVIHRSKIIHSYPYDWRTKKPVIIKTSKQWFINTEELKAKALELLEAVKIHPRNVENGMLSQLVRRPYWCISRQRVWGVPIPVFYDKDSEEPIVSAEIIKRLCDLTDKTGSTDFWWSLPTSEIMPSMENDKYLKGQDIFDIWYDSGISWNLLRGKTADMYLEGKDQFQGWFQSSLLMSTALRGVAPYKNLYVHGFVVDEYGKKMSKSIGNVINPSDVVSGSGKNSYPGYGADVLRWWVATQGSADGGNIAVSSSLLRSSDENVQKLRNVIKFLISYCNERSSADLNLEKISYDELMYTDQYMLHLLRDFRNEVTQHYDEYNYHRALMKILHFSTTQISAQYFTWVKDRLYCDFLQSQSRKSCIFVLTHLYTTLAKVLAPVLPYLVEESFLHYKLAPQSIFKSLWGEDDPSWENPLISSTFETALDVRESLNHIIGANNPKDLWVELQCDAKTFKTLQLLHPVPEDDMDKCESELVDILQVSGIDLKCYETEESIKDGTCPKDNPLQPIKFSIQPTGVSHSLTGFSVGVCKSEMMQCARCRRYCCTPGDVLCSRCLSVMKGLLQKQSKEVNQSSQLLQEKRQIVTKQG